LAAANTCIEKDASLTEMAKVAGVSIATMSRYLVKATVLKQSGQSVRTVLKKTGHPFGYPVEVDAAFLAWLDNRRTLTCDRNTQTMLDMYRNLYHEKKKRRLDVADDALAAHIRKIYRKKGWKMVRPKAIDAKRCAIYPTLKAWYENRRTRRAFKGVHPRLIYNGDETQIGFKGRKPRNVLKRHSFRAKVVVDDRTGSHVSLFIVVSAEGKVAGPAYVLHGAPNKFIQDKTIVSDLRCYRTPKGYMNKETFFKIMNEGFNPFCEERA